MRGVSRPGVWGTSVQDHFGVSEREGWMEYASTVLCFPCLHAQIQREARIRLDTNLLVLIPWSQSASLSREVIQCSAWDLYNHEHDDSQRRFGKGDDALKLDCYSYSDVGSFSSFEAWKSYRELPHPGLVAGVFVLAGHAPSFGAAMEMAANGHEAAVLLVHPAMYVTASVFPSSVEHQALGDIWEGLQHHRSERIAAVQGAASLRVHVTRDDGELPGEVEVQLWWSVEEWLLIKMGHVQYHVCFADAEIENLSQTWWDLSHELGIEDMAHVCLKLR